MISIRPGRSWRHNPSYAGELARLGAREAKSFDGARILDVLGIEVDGVDIAAGVGEAPLCQTVDELAQACLQLARGAPAAQATVGPGPVQVLFEARGQDVRLTLLTLRSPARLLASGLLVDGARLRAAALGAAQRVIADLLDLGPALRESPWVARMQRELRALARARLAAAGAWPPEGEQAAGFVVRGAARESGPRLEVRVPAESAARLAARDAVAQAPLAALLGEGALALRFGKGDANALSIEGSPWLLLRELLRAAGELVRAFESGEPLHLLRLGPLELRCDLTRDELRAAGLRDAVPAPPLALAEACATAAQAFARKALKLSAIDARPASSGRTPKPKRRSPKPHPERAAPSLAAEQLEALASSAAALLAHCRDLASGHLHRAPESVRAPPVARAAPQAPALALRGEVRRLVHRLAFELEAGPIGEAGLLIFPEAGAAVMQGAAGVFAVDLATSARLWHHAGVGTGPRAIAQAGDSLYALEGETLLSLDPLSGAAKFRRVVRDAGHSLFPAPGGCAVTLASGGVALVREGGALAFRTRLPEEPASLIAAEGLLLAQLPSGQLAALDALEGAELWRRRIGLRAGPLSRSGARVLACAHDHRGARRLVCLELASGETAWERPLSPLIDPSVPARSRSLIEPAPKLEGDEVAGRERSSPEEASPPGEAARDLGATSAAPEPLALAPPEPALEFPSHPAPLDPREQQLAIFGERCAVFSGRGLLACHLGDGAPAFARDLPWGPSGHLAEIASAASAGEPDDAALLALGPGAAALLFDAQGSYRWTRPPLEASAHPPLAPIQRGQVVLLACGPAELADTASGRPLARLAAGDVDAAALLADLSALLHLRDGTLARLRLATHLSLV